MKKISQKIILLFVVILATTYGCKKGINSDVQANNDQELIQKFFVLPTNIKPEVKRVYDYLKAKNEAKEFVSHFVKTQGLLDWSKATVSKKNNVVTLDSDEPPTEDPIYVEIPLTETTLDFAKGFLIAKETNQNIQLLLVNGEKFKSLSNGELTDNILNAEDLAMKLMIMNKELYGNAEFKIVDNQLFDIFVPQNERTEAALVGGKVVVNNLSINSISTYGRFVSYTTSYSWETPTKCCKTPDFCNKQPGGCDWNQSGGCSSCTCYEHHSIPVTVTSWLESPEKDWEDYGGNSGGGGGTGTGTGTSTTTVLDCNPELLPMQVFKLCDPDNKGIELLDVDDDINLEPFDCQAPEIHLAKDSIRTSSERVMSAFKYILPPEYASYVLFDSLGNLNKDTLLKAKRDTSLSKSLIYNALVVCINSNFNIDLHVTSVWEGKIGEDTTIHNYSWESSVQSIEAITVVPGPIPNIAGVPATGIPNTGWIFIRKGKETSNERLAFIIAHELLGHMYSFLVNHPYIHNDPDFDSWIYDIEHEATKNWKNLKRLQKTNYKCLK